MSGRRAKRTYTDDFKKQIVNLYNNGKKSGEIIKEYDLTPSTFHKWVRYYNNSGSFKEEDNRTEEEKQLIEKDNGIINVSSIKGKETKFTIKYY